MSDSPYLFQVSAQDSEQGVAELLLGSGYAVVRRWYRMTRPLDGESPEAPRPRGWRCGPLRLYERCGYRPVLSGSDYRKPFGLGG
jgi:hypothetical protein